MTQATMETQRIEPPGVVRQVVALTRRNLIHIKRMPEMLADVTFQPVMFVLLFAFVFGGSIATRGAEYREWLLPGIMGQTMAFSSFIVAIGLNNDLSKGVIDRFRALPIHGASVLVARSLSAMIHSSIGVVVMSLTGLVVGWRIHTGVLHGLLGYLLLLVFGASMIWAGILLGSVMRSPEAVNGVAFALIFPLTFVANTFAPTEGMPHWLRVIAEWNPISSLVQAMRNQWGNGGAALPDAQWPLHHPEVYLLGTAVALSLVFAPLALVAYRRRASS